MLAIKYEIPPAFCTPRIAGRGLGSRSGGRGRRGGGGHALGGREGVTTLNLVDACDKMWNSSSISHASHRASTHTLPLIGSPPIDTHFSMSESPPSRPSDARSPPKTSPSSPGKQKPQKKGGGKDINSPLHFTSFCFLCAVHFFVFLQCGRCGV